MNSVPRKFLLVLLSPMSLPIPRPAIVYPESNSRPIAENTLQFEWIVTIKEGLDFLFDDDPNVFVAGDLLWYPTIKGGATKLVSRPTPWSLWPAQGIWRLIHEWEENGIPPQVVFEVLSPGNRPDEMIKKHRKFFTSGMASKSTISTIRTLSNSLAGSGGVAPSNQSPGSMVSRVQDCGFDLSSTRRPSKSSVPTAVDF